MQQSGLAAEWSYVIHVNGTFAPDTTPGRQVVYHGDSGGFGAGHASRSQFHAWETSGAVALQRWIDSAILRLHGVPAPSVPATNGSGGFPVPSSSLRLALPFDAGVPPDTIANVFTPLMPLFGESFGPL